jgi:hypothetical protein
VGVANIASATSGFIEKKIKELWENIRGYGFTTFAKVAKNSAKVVNE